MKTLKNRTKKHKMNINRHSMRMKKRRIYHEKNLLRQKNLLKKKIKSLPIDLQKKLCILTWRRYWRDFIPITARSPSFVSHSNHIRQQLWESHFKNIHFLHLPFNTLPQNKQWIMGCQCDSCINDTSVYVVEKHCHSLIQFKNSSHFSEIMPNESISLWNNHFSIIGDTLVKIFDPLCGSYKEYKLSKNLRLGIPIHFSYFPGEYVTPPPNNPVFKFTPYDPTQHEGLFIFGKDH